MGKTPNLHGHSTEAIAAVETLNAAAGLSSTPEAAITALDKVAAELGSNEAADALAVIAVMTETESDEDCDTENDEFDDEADED